MQRTATSHSAQKPRRARVSGRRRELTDGARTLLLAAILHEGPIQAVWLDALAVTDADVDTLLASRLLIESEGGLCLEASANAEVLRSESTWSKRRRLHALLAEACARSPDCWAHAARHFEQAGKPANAARAYLSAAEHHRRQRRTAEALGCLQSALRLLPADTPPAEITEALVAIAPTATACDQVENALAFLGEWMQSSPWRDRDAVQAAADLALASLLAESGRHLESAERRRTAARALLAAGSPAHAAGALLSVSTTLVYSARFSGAVAAAEEARHAADLAGDASLHAQSLIARGLALGMAGKTAEAREDVEAALDIALGAQLPGIAAEAYRLLGTVAEYASCYRDEQAAFAKALAYCRRHDQAVTAGLCMGCLSYSLFRSGDWKKSAETARCIVADRKVHAASRCVAEGVLGLLHAHRGENRLAATLLKRSLVAGRRAGILAMDFFNLLGLALVAECAGSDGEAASQYRTLLDIWRATEDRHDALPALSCAAVFFGERLMRRDLERFAEALAAIAASTSNPEARGASLAAEAELAALRNDQNGAVEAFRRALKAYEERDLIPELLRTRLRLGCALHRAGNKDEARTVLSDVKRRAQRLGARPLAAKAAAQLNVLADEARGRAGDEAARSQERGDAWDLLSPRQREVARFLAQGAANKDIAAQTGLSVRTVEMHVAAVLTRLDCRSRTQAVARIAAALG